MNKWLDYYTEKFGTVELNSSFYHLPKEKTIENWYKNTPGNFIFSCKASRYITHIKKLNGPEESLKKFFGIVKGMKEKLGVILFQLPPNLGYDIGKLKNFTDALSSDFKYTIEFRNSNWWREETFSVLEKNDIAFCIYELGDISSPKKITGSTVYVRLHGPSGKYKGDYNSKTLADWADFFWSSVKSGKEVFCYFDNDEKGYAAKNAGELEKRIKLSYK